MSVTPDASLTGLPLWSRCRVAWAALRGRPVMTYMAFRWTDEHGWQNDGIIYRKGKPAPKVFVAGCSWDGPLWVHPWTTSPLLEADMLALDPSTVMMGDEDG